MNNFTLIIPTHNRHRYLKRSIAYFKNLEADVIYCDSSEKKFEGLLSSNMTYFHLPGKGFAAKILEVLQIVKNPFVSLCADDDFILIDSLYKGCDFMNENKSITSLIGQEMFFYENFDGNFYVNRGVKTKEKTFNFGSLNNVSVFFKNYSQILWGLHNKCVLKKSFELIQKAKFVNDNFIELTISGISCYYGGIKILNNFFTFRELTESEHWGNRHKPLKHFNFDYKLRNDFKTFRKLIDEETQSKYSDLILSNYREQNIFNLFLISLKINLKYLLKKISRRKQINKYLNVEKTNNNFFDINDTLKKFKN